MRRAKVDSPEEGDRAKTLAGPTRDNQTLSAFDVIAPVAQYRRELLGCADDSSRFELCKELSYTPHPLASSSVVVALPTEDNADRISVFNVTRLMLPGSALRSPIVFMFPSGRSSCARLAP